MLDVTAAAAARLEAAVRAAGVVGMPRVRVRRPSGTDALEFVVEDQREPGDEVREVRGIRFYLDDEMVRLLGGTRLVLQDDMFVFRRRPPADEATESGAGSAPPPTHA